MSFVTNFESYALNEISQQLADVYNTVDDISNMYALEIQKYLENVIKATPHKDCVADAQSDFSLDCIKILQAY